MSPLRRVSSRFSQTCLALSSLVWVIVMLVGYYYIHKPISFSQASRLGSTLLDLAAVAALSGLAGGIGRRFLPADTLAPLERFALQAALGWGLLGLFWLGAGLLKLYSSWFAWAAVIVGWAFCWRHNLAWMHELRSLKHFWASGGRLDRTMALGSLILIAGQLLFALSPPLKWDALMYHLDLPRVYLAEGQFTMVESNLCWGNPQLGEMLYTWSMALRGWETAAVLGWGFMAVLLLGVLGFVARRPGQTGGWLAVTALLAGTSFRGMLGWGYVEGLAALYGLAALVALLSALDARGEQWLRWVGVFIGLALGAKLTAGILFPFLVIVLFSNSKRSRSWWRGAIWVGSLSMLFFLPWLLKNGWYTGNLLYPYLWPTEPMSSSRLAFFSRTGDTLGWQNLWLPVALTWLGVEGGAGFATDIGPLLIMFAVPGLLAQRKRQDIQVASINLIGGWLFIIVAGLYSVTLWQTRYYFPLLPAAALAAGWGWRALQEVSIGGVRLRRVAGAVVVLVLLLCLCQDAVSLVRLNPAGVVLGVRSPQQYLDDALGWYSPAMRALHDLPPDARPLLLWEPRGLYAPLRSQPDTWIDRWYLDRRTLGDPHAILQRWRELGYTHLLINHAGADFERSYRPELTSADWEALDAILSRLTKLEDFGQVYALYSLAESP